MPLNEVFPLLDAINLPIELTMGSTVEVPAPPSGLLRPAHVLCCLQARDPYAAEDEKEQFWPVRVNSTTSVMRDVSDFVCLNMCVLRGHH